MLNSFFRLGFLLFIAFWTLFKLSLALGTLVTASKLLLLCPNPKLAFGGNRCHPPNFHHSNNPIFGRIVRVVFQQACPFYTFWGESPPETAKNTQQNTQPDTFPIFHFSFFRFWDVIRHRRIFASRQLFIFQHQTAFSFHKIFNFSQKVGVFRDWTFSFLNRTCFRSFRTSPIKVVSMQIYFSIKFRNYGMFLTKHMIKF